MSESAYLTRAREFVRKHWTAAGAVGFPTDALASLLTQVRNETAAEMEQDNKRLREALGKCTGYLLNAKIDIETGAPRRTALATIEGGLNMARSALKTGEQAL